MQNRATMDSLALALEERLGVKPNRKVDGLIRVFFEGDFNVSARFSDDGARILLTTPVTAAHDGLPQAVLVKVLKHNSPAGELAGGILRTKAGQDFLEIANDVPTDIGAMGIANIMINQTNAAIRLTAEIRDAVGELL